ncbi:MAG: hypothetical protein ACKVVP_08205 [Chloroflexota bacterium]
MTLDTSDNEQRYLHPAKHGELAELQALDAYDQWQEDEAVPVYHGSGAPDLGTLELSDWARRGVRGAILDLDGTGGLIDAHLIEVAAGGESLPIRHLYEEIVYAVSGRGNCAVWYGDGPKQSFEWSAGSLFAIPLNAWSQIYNGSGQEPARLFSVTNLPSMLRTFRNVDFIFNNEFAFRDRFSGDQGYFSQEGKLWHRGLNHVWETNFVPDVRTQTLHANPEPGVGTLDEEVSLAANNMGAYLGELVRGTYQKARRLSSPEHVIFLSGEGYTFRWRPGSHSAERVPWQAGTLNVEREGWFHQHFNMSNGRSRYLAIRFRGAQLLQLATNSENHEHDDDHDHDHDHDDHDHAVDSHVGHDHEHETHNHDHETHDHDHEGHDHDHEELAPVIGDTFIEYEDEDPVIRQVFEDELRSRHIPSEMDRLLARWREYVARTQANG